MLYSFSRLNGSYIPKARVPSANQRRQFFENNLTHRRTLNRDRRSCISRLRNGSKKQILGEAPHNSVNMHSNSLRSAKDRLNFLSSKSSRVFPTDP